jgi:chromosome partitioning protein
MATAAAKRPIIIAVESHKGGVAKSTTTVGLADYFGNKLKKRVLIIDADEQSNLKTIFGLKMQDVSGGLAAVLMDNVNPANIMVKVRENIDLILSGGRLMRDLEKNYVNVPDAELVMKRRFDSVISHDVVLIDCPPALSLISAAVSVYADYTIIPCSPELLAYVGVKNTVAFIESLGEHLKKRNVSVAKVLGVLPTMFDPRRTLDNDVIDDLHRQADNGLLLGGVVFDPIRADHKVRTSQVKRRFLSETFPTSKATQDYMKLGDAIMALIEKDQGKAASSEVKAQAVRPLAAAEV